MTGNLPALAITGATGALGGRVARLLADAGMAQRLLVRTAGRAPQLEKAVVLECSYSDRAASQAALKGVGTLFMVSASESADRVDQHCAFIDSARAAGVRNLVYTSFLGAAPDATFTLARDHFATEEYIRATGINYTILRNSVYGDLMAALVGEDGMIRGPAGDGRVAVVSRADIARTAETVLKDPAAHRNRTYNLTGPEALTLTEIARALSGGGGTAVTFHDETLAEAYESRMGFGVADWQVEAWVSTYTAIAAGELAGISTDIETITGRRPISLSDLLAADQR
ncbi:SDR family oxidoreductase [Arthrobacter sp. Br18]|uniref:SDR family oxidoreductase n=1 Tax=Arthrobacter sp. Br18 TaxID=1312954 RepID=UPI00047DA5CD|nr:SDR family oxidoreductase [Arthrobacter sp. Br18]